MDKYGTVPLNFVQGALAQSPGNLGSWNSSQTSTCSQWMPSNNWLPVLLKPERATSTRVFMVCLKRTAREQRGSKTAKCWRARIDWTEKESQLTNIFPVSIEAIDIHVSDCMSGKHDSKIWPWHTQRPKVIKSCSALKKEIWESQFWELGPTLHTKKFGLRLVLPRACALKSNATPRNGYNCQILGSRVQVSVL